MNFDRLKQGVSNHALVSENLLPFLEQKENKILSLDGIKGSALSFLLSSLWEKKPRTFVVVVDDFEAASYLQNDIERILESEDAYLFPSSFKHKNTYEEINSTHIMLRTETVARLSSLLRPPIIVTYPEALFEKVVRPDALSEKRIEIKVGEELDVDAILRKLIDIGFKREDFVYEPGQFAMRGDILDIYSYGNEHPYRVELFGNEVDSVRIFNPETQLSERRILHVSILPNIDQAFQPDQKDSFLSLLPEDTVMWFSDLDHAFERFEYQEANLEEMLENVRTDVAGTSSKDPELVQPTDFEKYQDWKENIQQFQRIEWVERTIEGTKDGDKKSYSFKMQEQPSFNRNFELLIKSLTTLQKDGYQLYIFAENPKQLERLRSIFEDLKASIEFTPIAKALTAGFIDPIAKIAVFTDHQIFQRYHKYKVKQAFSKSKAMSLKALRELQPGDFVAHIDHGIGEYSGLQKIDVNGNVQEAIRILYRDNDVLYVNINSLHKISKYTGKDGTKPRVHKLGGDQWAKLKSKTKRQVKEIATDLIKLYAKRKASEGFAHSPDNYLQTELESSFIFEDTPDQSKATEDVKRDMESPTPMDRLVCGDVGFGKTEVAIRAAFKTVNDGKQAAILVPTTILAHQHYQTFKERLQDLPVNVDYLNRFKTAKQKRETLEKLKNGETDIIIGTHALVGKQVVFNDLGLLVIDEEQKFGVAAKEKIREHKTAVDTLTLTATPIPRTLQFSLMAARDLSIINTPPLNRQPVDTELVNFDEEVIREAILFELSRGGQVYFIHNRVKNLPQMVEMLRSLCPEAEIEMAHGQMEGRQLEKTLIDFVEHKFDVLCATNIVESGVDIANANTILINNAHHFGLSDLHQLRGRVGRSNRKAFCYLMIPSLLTLPSESQKRLRTLEQFTELGSGFQIAMRDLDLRGAGDLLGGSQSGFIADIGIEMYQKILNEAIRELKSSDFKEVFKEEVSRTSDYVTECTLDTDWEVHIPDNYIENVAERLNLYTQLDHVQTDEELEGFKKNMLDRFGPLPKQVEGLFLALKARRIAKELGFERMVIKNKIMRLYFINQPDSIYYESQRFFKILQYIQEGTHLATMKQDLKNVSLVVKKMKDIETVFHFLSKMDTFVRIEEEKEPV